MRLVSAYQSSDKKTTFVYRDENKNRVYEEVDTIPKYYYVEDSNGGEKVNERGKPLKRVDTVQLDKKMYGMAVSDTEFTRLMMHRDYEDSNIPLRIANLDIETDDKEGFPDIKKGNAQVVLYVLYDSYEDKYYIHGLKQLSISELANKIGHLRFKYFKHANEYDMIMWLKSYFEQMTPDIITGYNVDFFDLKYLKVRAKKALGIDLNYQKSIIFDMERGYKHIKPHEESYRLDDVCKKEFGEGKVPRKEIWKMEPLDLAYYCYKDVFLVNKLNEKLRIISYHESIANGTNSHILQSFYPTVFGYNAILTLIRDEDIVFPLPTSNEKMEKIEGGLVFEPSKGIYKNVLVFDIKGSYPSMILSYNISPETIIYNEKDEPIGFSTEKMGILPRVIEHFLKKRNEYKKLLKSETNPILRDGYDTIQYAMKTITNSFYGIFTDESFALYNEFVAVEITRTGRETIQSIADYLTVVLEYAKRYGDTDSLFVNAKTDDCENEGKEVARLINVFLDERMANFGKKNYIVIEFEKYYKQWLQTGVKKRYAGIKVADGKEELQIKGFEVIRRGNSLYTKDTQKKMIELLLTGTVKDVKDFYDREQKKWLEENVPVSRIAINYAMRMSKEDYKVNVPVLKALEASKKRGIKVDEKLGRFWAYYLKDGDIIALNVGADLPKGLKVDFKEHMRICFESPLEVLRTLIVDQKTLDKYF